MLSCTLDISLLFRGMSLSSCHSWGQERFSTKHCFLSERLWLFSFPECFTLVTSLPTSATILAHEGFISRFEISNIIVLALSVDQPNHVLPTNVETSFVRAQLALQTYSLIQDRINRSIWDALHIWWYSLSSNLSNHSCPVLPLAQFSLLQRRSRQQLTEKPLGSSMI